MNSKVHLQSRLLLPVVALVFALAMIAAFIWRDKGAEAHAPHPGLDFSIAIQAVGSTPTPSINYRTPYPKTNNACDTDPLTVPGTRCSLLHDSRFMAKVYLNDRADIDYYGVDMRVDYEGVTFIFDPDDGARGPDDPISPSAYPWPGCYFHAYILGDGLVRWACGANIDAPSSTYTGLVGTAEFSCTNDGLLSLVHGTSDTEIWDAAGDPHAEGRTIRFTVTPENTTGPFTPTATRQFATPTYVGNVFETLAIDCNAPTPTPCAPEGCPTDTPTATPTNTSTPTPCPDFDGDSLCDNVDPDDDNDGCPDAREQQTPGREFSGGRRDFHNPWDYFNPTQDGINRMDDISAVLLKYGHDQDVFGDYDVRYDRTALPGGHPWQFGPPDGIIRTFEITAAVLSYGHDCS